MSEEATNLGVHSTRPERERKTLKLGFNGFVVIFQLILTIIIVMAVIVNRSSGSSVASIEMGMIGGVAVIVLAVTLPFATLAALLGLRKRFGAGRPPGQPRKIFTFDLLALVICVLLLLSPIVVIMLNAHPYG